MNNDKKLDIETFYKNLQRKFPELQKLPIWNEWNWNNDGVEHSPVMSELANEMMRWSENHEWQNVAALLNEIETAFIEGTHTLIAYLGTDFTVTITECKDRQIREHIKSLMGQLTYDCYQMNLRGYREF